MTNADLIAEARASHNLACPVSQRLADALEAADAQVARLAAALALHGHLTAREGTHLHPWPADLLEAVDLLDVAHTRGCKHPACAKAVATLKRYGLLPERAAHAD